MSKSIAETIRDYENTLGAKKSEIKTILDKAADAGLTLDDEEADQVQELRAECKMLERDLGFWRDLQATAEDTATPITKEKNADPQKSATAFRGGAPAVIKNREPDEAFQGQFFTQRVIIRALAKIDGVSAAGLAQQRLVRQAYRGRQNALLAEVIKANEVAAGAETSGEWGAELVQADGRYTGDFIEYLYARTIFDQLGLREVPANVTIKGQDGAATAYWTGEGLAAKATTGDFSSVTLTPLKLTALAAVNKELLRDSSPSAEMLVRDALIEAIAQKVDSTFLSTSAASSGVSPAGMLNGVSAKSSGGTTADDVAYDINQLYSDFISANNASGLNLVMSTGLAKAISLLRTSLGMFEYPQITATGGTLLGDPVKTGDNVNANHMILLKPSDIYKIGDLGVQVSMSDQATLEMSTAPTGDNLTPTAASANLQSMFQEDSVAFKVVRPLNWAKRRSGAVQYVSDAAYTPTSS